MQFVWEMTDSLNITANTLQHQPAEPEAQTCAPSRLLGRYRFGKKALSDFGWNTGACVPNSHADFAIVQLTGDC